MTPKSFTSILPPAIAVFLISAQPTLASGMAERFAMQTDLDHVWVVTAAAMVLMMQVGFLLLEAGQVRSKNSVNVAQKNLIDFVLSLMAFGAIGFAVMFGATQGGWFGYSSDYSFYGAAENWTMTFFIFQAVFCGTAATIVSGAVAERMTMAGYISCTLLLALAIYPVIGHWAWGGLLLEQTPFLAAMGFMDFAGGTVVHSTGAWVALAAIIIIGPRQGKFDEEGRPRVLHGHSPVLATAGALIIWFGWIGFNGGSLLVGSEAFSQVIMNTMIGGGAGGLAQIFIGRYVLGHYRPESAINGVLAGLVGVTAGADVFDAGASVAIGFSAGIVAFLTQHALEWWFRLDDPLGAISVHGFAGVWGTIMIAVMAPEESLLAGSRIEQFGVQLMGAGMAFAWAFGIAFIVLGAISRVFASGPNGGRGLRVDEEHERIGLNVAEHAAPMGAAQFQEALAQLVDDPNAAVSAIEIDHGDENYETAVLFNQLLEHQRETEEWKAWQRRLVEEEIGEVIAAAAAGDFQRRVDLKDKSGFYRRVSESINMLCEGTSNSFSSVTVVVQALAAGDLSKRVEGEFSGDIEALQTGLNQTLDSLSETIRQVEKTVEAASAGDFSARVDAGDTSGFIRNLCDGVNAICETSETGLAEFSHVIERLAEGDLSATMTGEQKGRFAEIRDNVNSTLSQLSQAIVQVESAVDAASHGNYDLRVDIADAKGFLRALCDGVNDICEASERGLTDLGRVFEHMAEGDLTVEMSDDYSGQLKDISDSVHATTAALRRMVGELTNAAADVAEIADETSTTSDTLREQSERQAREVASAKAALHQMDETARQARDAAETARARSVAALEEAEQGREVAQETAGQMDVINVATDQIARSVMEIEEIALKTHLLSINASVEAAREAGEGSEGFKVVAEEIRSLAAHVQMAAHDIRKQTEGVCSSVEQGRHLVDRAQGALDRIVSAVSEGAERVGDLAAESTRQADLVSTVRVSIDETDKQTQSALRLAVSTQDAAGRLTQSSHHAKTLLSRFSVEDKHVRKAA